MGCVCLLASERLGGSGGLGLELGGPSCARYVIASRKLLWGASFFVKCESWGQWSQGTLAAMSFCESRSHVYLGSGGRAPISPGGREPAVLGEAGSGVCGRSRWAAFCNLVSSPRNYSVKFPD